MSEQLSPNPFQTGQAESAPPASGTSDDAPAVQDGQAEAHHSQDLGQAQSTPTTGEQTFFDPNQVPPELLPAYKQMQGAFTQKTQDISRQKQKIEAYDAFMRDPVGQIQNLAAQYGMHLTRAQAQQQLQESQGQSQQWEPQTWDEVMVKAEERAEQRIMQRLAPYLGQVQQMQAGQVEHQLNSIDTNWREYESTMRELLQQHPTLVNNVALLYRMAVPPEIMEGKAIQQALKRFEDKAKHQGVTQQGSALRSKPASPKITSFEDAFQDAKRRLASGEG